MKDMNVSGFRTADISRSTKETQVHVALNLDGTGSYRIDTGIGFFDHMLELFSRHSGIDLAVDCKGDLHVDGHHTTEDVGIVLGKAIRKALGDKRGILRYGDIRLPMDESLASCAMDISGRGYLVFRADFSGAAVGQFATELTEEFFRAVAIQTGLTLHLCCEYGSNDHHRIEALFKAFGRAFRQAIIIDPDYADVIPSTKGVLE